MVANFDRYYKSLNASAMKIYVPIVNQIHPNRLETPFMSEQEIRDMFEGMIRGVFKIL